MTRAGNCGFPPSPSRYRSACITLTVCDDPHCREAGFEKPSVQPKEMCAGAPLDRRRLRTGTRTSVARPSPYQTSSPRRAEFLATMSRHACDTMSHRYPDPCRAARTGGGRAVASSSPPSAILLIQRWAVLTDTPPALASSDAARDPSLSMIDATRPLTSSQPDPATDQATGTLARNTPPSQHSWVIVITRVRLETCHRMRKLLHR